MEEAPHTLVTQPKTERNFSFLKVSILGIVVVLSAGVFGWAANTLLSNWSGRAVILTALAGLLWMALVVLQTILVDRFIVSAILFVIEVTALFMTFFSSATQPALIGAAVLLAFLLIGFSHGRSTMKNSLKIHFFKFGGLVMPALFTGLSALLTLYFVSSFTASGFTVPRRIFDSLMASAEPVVGTFFGGFRNDMSIDDFLRIVARRRLPKDTPEEALTLVVAQVRAEVDKLVGQTLRGDEVVGDIFYELASRGIRSIPDRYRDVAIVVAALFVFSALKGFSFLVGWIVLLVAFALYHILLAFNFFSISFIPEDKEVIIVR